MVGHELVHDQVLDGLTQRAVQQADLELGKNLLGQAVVDRRDGFEVQRLLLLDHRADDIDLAPFSDRTAHQLLDPGPVAAGGGIGGHRAPAWRQLVDQGDIHVAVEHQGE